MIHHSIRWRIQAWHSVLLVGLVIGMLGAFYGYERAQRLGAVDAQLEKLLTPLLPAVTPMGDPEGGGDFPDGPPRRRIAPDFANGPFYFKAWSPRGDLIRKSEHAEDMPMPIQTGRGESQSLRSRGEFRELVYFGPGGNAVVIGTSAAPVLAALHHFGWNLAGAGLVLFAVGLIGGWWVAGYALRPIDEISATARQITGGQRARRIEVRETESELGRLAMVLNRTFDQQDNAFEQQIRFTADASHELRTPVSVILTQVQLALSREREAQEYRETLQICQRAAERMRGLVNSLLELARVDSGEFKIHASECDLGTIALDAMELIAPLSRQKGAVLKSAVQPMRIQADADKMGQVVVNLLHNAIHHNSREIEVCVSVSREGQQAVLRVSDNGAGIPAEALPHVFERFYRADKSRTGSTNGNGLGLAISQAIVAAHGGIIEVESKPGQGAACTVRLPLAG